MLVKCEEPCWSISHGAADTHTSLLGYIAPPEGFPNATTCFSTAKPYNVRSNRHSGYTLLRGQISVNVDLGHGNRDSIPEFLQGDDGDMLLFINSQANNERGGTTVAELCTWCRAVTGQGGLLELQAPDRPLKQFSSTTWFYRMTDTTFCKCCRRSRT